ncbi:hypothetical protein B0H14DRAFT_3151902 [Mycena olivaceomarginata]|nr:hypothetical protein B0H14DRAFT_3151902 [Mycena olivaceomarginata]
MSLFGQLQQQQPPSNIFGGCTTQLQRQQSSGRIFGAAQPSTPAGDHIHLRAAQHVPVPPPKPTGMPKPAPAFRSSFGLGGQQQQQQPNNAALTLSTSALRPPGATQPGKEQGQQGGQAADAQTRFPRLTVRIGEIAAGPGCQSLYIFYHRVVLYRRPPNATNERPVPAGGRAAGEGQGQGQAADVQTQFSRLMRGPVRLYRRPPNATNGALWARTVKENLDPGWRAPGYDGARRAGRGPRPTIAVGRRAGDAGGGAPGAAEHWVRACGERRGLFGVGFGFAEAGGLRDGRCATCDEHGVLSALLFLFAFYAYQAAGRVWSCFTLYPRRYRGSCSAEREAVSSRHAIGLALAGASLRRVRSNPGPRWILRIGFVSPSPPSV